MTIICALPDGDETILGCDQRAGDYLVPTKWVVHGRWAIGVSGAYRTQQLIERATIPITDDPFVVSTWIRGLMIEDGYKSESNDPPGFESNILLSTPGRVWSVKGCFTAIEVAGFAAAGSGREYAIGAAWAAKKNGAAMEIVDYAVRAAICNDPDGCGGDSVVVAQSLAVTAKPYEWCGGRGRNDAV